MQYKFRKANISDVDQIWGILKFAIQSRKVDGSNQWQDGYPNPEVIQNDINNNEGYVLVDAETIVGYSAIIINDEPEYANIEGRWLTNGDFVVFHRVAISKDYLGKGLAKKLIVHIEQYALKKSICSVKADTNFDNNAMLKIFDSMGYTYCGEVYFRGSPRKAYEKIISE